MATSAVFGTRLVAFPSACASLKGPSAYGGNGDRVFIGGAVIECSSRPQKKATKHHMKTRPRKTQPWDINRKPTVRTPLPPLPPDWTLVEPAPALIASEVTDDSG